MRLRLSSALKLLFADFDNTAYISASRYTIRTQYGVCVRERK